jgi:hypothetical protein
MQYKNIRGTKYMIKVVNGKFCNVETIILQNNPIAAVRAEDIIMSRTALL